MATLTREEKEHVERALPPEMLLLLAAFRSEMDARFQSMKLWGALALLFGGTLGGLASRLFAPAATQGAVAWAVSLLT